MMKIVYLLGIVTLFTLFSCGSKTETLNKDKVVITQDTTLSEQELAFKNINNQLKNDISNPTLYLKRAKLYQKYGALPKAIEDIDRAISVDSLQPKFYLLKAELYKRQGKLKESKKALDKCMFIDNNNVEARIQLGWLALLVDNYKQALDYADAALKRNVYSAETYFLKGMIFLQKKDTVTAISSFKTAVEQENDYYDAYIQLGALYYNKPNDIAIAYYKNAIRIRPTSLEALYDYAICNQDKGKYDEAIKTYQELLSIKKYREPYFNMGFINQEYLNDYKKAIENYTKALAIEPKYLEAYYNRGLCYEKIKDYNNAEENFRAALKLKPTYTYAAIALERVLKNKK